mgnify:CR=1 FL=1
MADDKKNIPDAGKVDEPPKLGKVEPVKADFPVQDRVEHHETEVFYEKTPCVYHRRMVRRGL